MLCLNLIVSRYIFFFPVALCMLFIFFLSSFLSLYLIPCDFILLCILSIVLCLPMGLYIGKAIYLEFLVLSHSMTLSIAASVPVLFSVSF